MSGLFETPRNAGTLFLGGTKISGSDIRDQNVLATQAVANVVKSSFGPSGKNFPSNLIYCVRSSAAKILQIRNNAPELTGPS